jgi:hypothetical protein
MSVRSSPRNLFLPSHLIIRSGEVSEFLQCEIGVAASWYPNEDAYLGAMHQFVCSHAADAWEFLDRWNLLDEVDQREFEDQLEVLAEDIMEVIECPLEERGPVDE